MSFFRPDALLWGLAAVPLLLLYLWRFGLRRREVSSLPLWHAALARRRPWRKWQNGVSLAVQLAALVCLVFALADPYWTGSWRGAATLVVIVDNSASMRATDVAPNRLARSLDDARQLVARLGPYDRAAVLAAGGTVRVLAPLTADPPLLRAALQAIPPTDGPNRLAEALATAGRLLNGQRNPRIVVLSDGAVATVGDAGDALPALPGIDVRWVLQHGAPENAGLTRVTVRPTDTDAAAHEVFFEVTNGGAQPARRQVELLREQQPLITESVDVSANGVVRRVVTVNLSAGGLLTVRLAGSDALAADDVVHVSVPPRSKTNVLLAGEPHVELEAALRALPLVDLQTARDVPSTVPAGSLLVLHGRVPAEFPPVPAFVFGPTNACDLWTVGAPVLPVERIEPTEATLLDGVRLASVAFDELIRLEFRAPARSLARTVGGAPVVSLIDRVAGQVAVFHATFDKCDLASRPELARLVANAVQTLGPSAARPRSYVPTDLVRLGESADSTASPKVLDPDSRPVVLPPASRFLGPFERVGLWRIEGRTADVIPVNLCDTRETNLQPTPSLRTSPLAEVAGRGGRPLWTFFAGLAVALLVVEWALQQRGVTT